ncbi:flagellar biosynthetic protein FliO [Marinicrinis sediminis]|uniref:Flagellar biosynthetic protein FliO n=1 Tax=Marinicrinis sediminis TaxID=1652465 RepID=A0ABW5R5R5_9BACL
MISHKSLRILTGTSVSVWSWFAVSRLGFAAENDKLDNSFNGWEPNFSSFIYVMVVLMVIIGLIIVLLRFIAQKNKTWFSQSGIRSISALTIAQNRSVHVVQIGPKIYVLGVGEDITVVDRIEGEEQVTELLNALDHQEQNQSLRGKLKLDRLWSKFPKKQSDKGLDHEVEPVSFQKVMLDRLHEMSNQKNHLHDPYEDDERNGKDKR